MGGFDFDRKPFAHPEPPEPKPKRPFAIPGSLILLVAVILGGIAAWRYVNVRIPQAPANNVALQQLNQKLDALEHRVDRLDRRRRASRAALPVEVYGEEAPLSVAEHSEPHPASVGHVSTLQGAKPTRPTSAVLKRSSAHQPGMSLVDSAGNKRLVPSVPASSPASQQEWEATANRLGDIAGVLAAQQNAIDQTQASLGQLSARLGPRSTPFTLEKGGGPQQVGPVRLLLERADLKHQRYTLRLLIGDQSIELKNRAVHEAVPFYTSGRAGSFALVVFRVGKDSVAGRLAFPSVTAVR